MEIYFDNSATTQPFECARQAVLACMTEAYYNPSALYAPAVKVSKILAETRAAFAREMRVKEEEIIFTSGGTESNVDAILGAVPPRRAKAHVITDLTEHSSVYETFRHLEQYGAEVTLLRPNRQGEITPEALQAAMRPDTRLVSVMQVNNETGAVNDIEALSKTAKRIAPHCIFHCDGVQAFPKLRFPGGPVDAYSVSGHKFHAPRGTGVLYLKNGSGIQPVMVGGGQEHGYRAGTENMAGIAGLGAALKQYTQNRDGYVQRMREVKQALYSRLIRIPGAHLNGPGIEQGAPHILSMSFEGTRGETLVHALEEQQIYVGTGSACSSHKKGVSRTLSAMEIPPQIAQGTLRFSFSCMNTVEQANIVARAVEQSVARVRRFVRR